MNYVDLNRQTVDNFVAKKPIAEKAIETFLSKRLTEITSEICAWIFIHQGSDGGISIFTAAQATSSEAPGHPAVGVPSKIAKRL